MKPIFIHLAGLAFILLAATSASAQCDCVPKLTLAQHFQRSDEVFVGRVLEATKTQWRADGYNVVIRLEVTQTWKNNLKRFVTAKEFEGSTDGFETNAEWLFYAVRDKDGTYKIVRDCCSRTKPIAVANKQGDFVAFKMMKIRPKKILETKESRTNRWTRAESAGLSSTTCP